MDKKSFFKLIECGTKPCLRTESLGDGWIDSHIQRIVIEFKEIIDNKTLESLYQEKRTHKLLGNKYSYFVDSFYFGYIGSSGERKEKSRLRLKKAELRYNKWLKTTTGE